MKSSFDVRMHAMAFLYDHLSDCAVWIRRLTPSQLNDIANVMVTWHATAYNAGEIAPLAEVEKREITRAISLCGGDAVRAARALGIGKTTLYRKIKQWGYSINNHLLIHQASALAEIPIPQPDYQTFNLITPRGKRGVKEVGLGRDPTVQCRSGDADSDNPEVCTNTLSPHSR
jgi:Bacterial regulatory protein, Fis family